MNARVGPLRAAGRAVGARGLIDAPPRPLSAGRALARALRSGGLSALRDLDRLAGEQSVEEIQEAPATETAMAETAKVAACDCDETLSVDPQIIAETEAAALAALEMADARRLEAEDAKRLRADLMRTEVAYYEGRARDAEVQLAADMVAAEQAAIEMLAAERAEAAQTGVGAAYGDFPDVLGVDRLASSGECDVALYVFDDGGDQARYSAGVFTALARYLENAHGLCVFCDGDLTAAAGGPLRGPEALRRLRGYASRIEAASDDSPLADLNAAIGAIRGYVAAMWTDRSENIAMLHLKLSQRIAPGYLGCFLLTNAQYRRLMKAGGAELRLIERYYFEDGAPSALAG